MSFAGKLGQFTDAFRDAYGEGREEWSRSYREGRKSLKRSEDAPRIQEMMGAYPFFIRAKEAMDDAIPIEKNPIYKPFVKDIDKYKGEVKKKKYVRKDLGLEPKRGLIPRAGQITGTAAADLTQDVTRNFYWLLNAAQATGNVIAESVLGGANNRKYGGTEKDLYGRSKVRGTNNELYNFRESEKIPTQFVTNQGGRVIPRKGYSWDEDGTLMRRNFEPGDKASLLIPTGFAINTGLGLMSPFGGVEGFKAAIPSEEDPTKTDNVVAEIATKYFLGRTGNLLPYDEFVKVRPDVSPGEYKAYQAFKYDNSFDLNPLDDGQLSGPAGIVKYTNEGILGPEVQFLGRSLPLNTAGVPFISALAGGAIGVRSNKPITGGLIGGTAGLISGMIGGNLIEQERRRRNTIENQMEYPQS